jgi:hypothetical protein
VQRVEAFYVLHQAGACRGIPVTVAEQDGGVRVSGQNQSGNTSYFTKIATIADVMGALSEIRQSNERLSSEPFAQFKSAATRESVRQVLFDAEALKTLADNFDRSQAQLLPNVSIQLLEAMVQEHAESLSRVLARMSDPSDLRNGEEPYRLYGNEGADWRRSATASLDGAKALAGSGSLETARLQPRIQDLTQKVRELIAESQVELDRDQQAAAIRKSRNRK